MVGWIHGDHVLVQGQLGAVGGDLGADVAALGVNGRLGNGPDTEMQEEKLSGSLKTFTASAWPVTAYTPGVTPGSRAPGA